MEINDPDSVKELRDFAEHCFTCSKDADAFAGKLYLASFYNACHRFEEALSIVKQICEKSDIVHIGLSSRNTKQKLNKLLIVDTRPSEEETQIGSTESKGSTPILKYEGTDITLDNSIISFDVVFSEMDALYLPQAVQYECVLMGEKVNWYYCLFHPVVYATLLKFDILWKTGTPAEHINALEELEVIVQTTKGEVEWHRALNILGHCFLKVGRLRKAYKCFATSISLLSSAHNAAVYQMCILVNTLNSSENGDCEAIYNRNMI